MCIRDRIKAEYVVLSLDAMLPQVKVDEGEVKAWYEGHKDRYQRAEERRASHIPVSYTHLDVYKRQGQIHTTHAYWVESIDVENDRIVVRNPWGYESSSDYRIELTYKEFVKSFDRIDVNWLES